MPSPHNLDLLTYQPYVKIRKEQDIKKIFDPVRKSWYVLKPEEFVRQLVILHLTNTLGYPHSRIAVEKQLKVNQMSKRFDVVVFDKGANPLILIECKSPKEKISTDAALQIANYNLSLNAKYLWLSNGRKNFFYQMDYMNNKAVRIPALHK